jgi:trk system potassium uptake protein TrkA
MSVVIVGCGNLGCYLANLLSEEGWGVIVVDWQEEAFSQLSRSFSGIKIVGDASEVHVLEEADIASADALIATTKRDNVNLMVAQIARQIYDVPVVLARVEDPNRQESYQEFNIMTICPTIMGALKLREMLAEKSQGRRRGGRR